MQLTMGQTHDLYVALSAIERGDGVRLAGDIRLKIAINLNRLKPAAQAFESARAKAFAQIDSEARAARESDAAIQAKLLDEANRLAATDAGEIDLQTLLKPDLRLDDNPAFTGAVLAQLWPILSGVE